MHGQTSYSTAGISQNSASDFCQDEEEEKEAQEETDPMKKMFKQMDYIEPRLPLLVAMISPTVSASVTIQWEH